MQGQYDPTTPPTELNSPDGQSAQNHIHPLPGDAEELSHQVQVLKDVLRQEGSIYNLLDDQMRYMWSLNYEVMGFTNEQTVGLSVLDTPGMPRQEAEYAYNVMKSVLDTGVPFESEGWFEVQPGVRRFSRFSYHALTLPNGRRAVLSIARDLTKEKLEEISMASTNAMLTKANQQLEGLNHELNEAYTALEEKSRQLQQEIEEARTLQLSMLPKQNPLPDRFSIATSMKTSEQVGGDYYDFARLEKRGLSVTLGDATGHGLRASLVVTAVRSYFQMLAPHCTPSQLLTIISNGIQSMGLERTFMGLAVLRFDGSGFRLASAGMPPLLWYKAGSRQVETLEQRTVFLGTSLVSDYSEMDLAVEPGDVLVMLTDGFTEARSRQGEFLPMDRIRAAVAKAAPLGCEHVVETLKALQREWTGLLDEVKDDSTLVVLQYKG